MTEITNFATKIMIINNTIIMPALKLHLYKSVEIDSTQHSLYEEALSFDGGLAFASEDELVVKKTDGTVFRTSLVHYESDVLTETYVGHFEDGKPFRFLFASNNNPLAAINPMVTFGSMSTSGWAVHFR